jgi:hypothetical protein
MSQREKNLLLLRDTLEQLMSTRHQLEWTEDPQTAQVLLESMLRDLDRTQRLCKSMQQRQLQGSAKILR